MIVHALMIAVFVVLAIGLLVPLYWAWNTVWYFQRHSRVTPAAPEPCPNTVVILCLRGADPSLESCLHGLLHQDFPHYQVRIVVDNRTDRAWQKVQDILKRGIPPNVDVQVSVLENPRSTCSLKVSAQLQVVRSLGSEVEVVVLLDADSIPAPDWLRALVLALDDPSVGAASGMRWFVPVDGGWGSLVRHIFNAGSYAQMFVIDHPWGGSMSIRAEVFRRTQLIARWRKALCEDSAITAALRSLGLKLVFVPAAISINSESIGVRASLRFVLRQLLCVRLDHVDWPLVLGANMANLFAVAALTFLGGLGLALGRWGWFTASAVLLTTFAGSMFWALMACENVVRRSRRLRGLATPPIVWTWRLVPAFFWTQFVCMWLLWKAHRMRSVAWRGIHYMIRGPGDIRLERYEPYRPEKHLPEHHSTV